jgi:hypothetical protein
MWVVQALDDLEVPVRSPTPLHKCILDHLFDALCTSFYTTIDVHTPGEEQGARNTRVAQALDDLEVTNTPILMLRALTKWL